MSHHFTTKGRGSSPWVTFASDCDTQEAREKNKHLNGNGLVNKTLEGGADFQQDRVTFLTGYSSRLGSHKGLKLQVEIRSDLERRRC
jgi:hypothetical protein